MDNVIGVGPGFHPPGIGTGYSFVDTSKVYSLTHQRKSGNYTITSANDKGGDYYTSQVVCHIPRGRQQVETLLSRLRNRPVMVIVVDKYDNQYFMYDARCTWTFATGDTGPVRNGYNVTFRSVSDYLFPGMAGSGIIDTAPPPPVGGDSGDGSHECCLTIAPLAIAYTPTPTGNTLNLNQVVTTQNGSIYIIDYTGRSILIGRPGPKYYRFNADGLGVLTTITLPMGFPIPDPDDYINHTDEIPRRFFVHYGGRWLIYTHGEGFNIDLDTNPGQVLFPDGINGGIVEFYSFEGIPAIPV